MAVTMWCDVVAFCFTSRTGILRRGKIALTTDAGQTRKKGLICCYAYGVRCPPPQWQGSTSGTCWLPKDRHTIKYALRYRFGNRSKYPSVTVFIENRIKLADIMIMMMMMIGSRWLSTLWPLLASAARMSRQCGVYLITSLPRLTVCCPELFSHCQLLHLSARCTAHRVWSEKNKLISTSAIFTSNYYYYLSKWRGENGNRFKGISCFFFSFFCS